MAAFMFFLVSFLPTFEVLGFLFGLALCGIVYFLYVFTGISANIQIKFIEKFYLNGILNFYSMLKNSDILSI